MGAFSRLQLPALVATLCILSGCLSLAAADQHSLPDEAVLASQSYWSSHFAELLRKGDASGCSKVYTDDASLYLSVKPDLSELQKAGSWKETQVARGHQELESFWGHLVEVLGKSYEGDANEGAFAPRKFVVNDDTVIVSGKVAFGAASGERRSQTWTREGSEWKISNEMLDLEDYQPPKKEAEAAAAVKEAGKIAEEAVKVEEASGGSVAKEAEAIGKGLLGGLGKEAKEISSEVKKEEKAKEEKKKEEKSGKSTPIAAAAEKKSHGSFTTILIVVLIGGGLAAWALRRSKRRNEAVIAGFDAMLG